MSDPFLSEQAGLMLSQELQRLQQENKKLREDNIKLQMQVKYMSGQSTGTSVRRGASGASVRSGASARTTGSRVSQLRRVASVSALASAPFELRAGVPSAQATSSSPSSGAAPRPQPTLDPHVGAMALDDPSGQQPVQANEAAEGRHSEDVEEDGDDVHEDGATPRASLRGKQATSRRRHAGAEADGTRLSADVERRLQDAQKESQHLRSRFESFVTYTCEREEGYNAVYTTVYAELAEAKARCVQLEAQSEEARQALTALQREPRPATAVKRALEVDAMVPSEAVMAACEAVEARLTSSSADTHDMSALAASVRTLTSLLRESHEATPTDGARGGVGGSRRRPRLASDKSGAGEQATQHARTPTEAAPSSSRTGGAGRKHPRSVSSVSSEAPNESETVHATAAHAEEMASPPTLRLVKGGAALRNEAARQLALHKATAKAQETSRTRRAPRRAPKAAPPPDTESSATATSTAVAVDKTAEIDALFPSSADAPKRRLHATFHLSAEDPIGSFLAEYHRQHGSAERAALREALQKWADDDVSALAAQAVRYLCRVPPHHPHHTPLTASAWGALVRQLSDDLEALLGVHDTLGRALVTGLRQRLVQLATLACHGTAERASQLLSLQVAATALRRAVYAEVLACRRGVRGVEAVRAAFARAMDAQLSVTFDLTLALLRAWRGTSTTDEDVEEDVEEADSGATDGAQQSGDDGEEDATGGGIVPLVGPVTRSLRLLDRWLCATEALCMRTAAEVREAHEAQAPPEKLPRRRLTYIIQALLSTCLGGAVAQAQRHAHTVEVMTAYWGRRWRQTCTHLGWSTRQLPLEALAKTMASTVSAAVGAGFEATHTVAYADAMAGLRLVIAYHGFPFVQVLKDQLTEALDSDEANNTSSDLITEPFAQLLSYAVLDLRLHDARDALWTSTAQFFLHYLSSVSTVTCRSPEEMAARLRPAHVLAARALLQLCDDVGQDGGVGDASDANGAATTLAAVVAWVLAHRAAVAVAQSRQEPPPAGTPRRHPLLDTALGQYVLHVCGDPFTARCAGDEEGRGGPQTVA